MVQGGFKSIKTECDDRREVNQYNANLAMARVLPRRNRCSELEYWAFIDILMMITSSDDRNFTLRDIDMHNFCHILALGLLIFFRVLCILEQL